MQELQLPQLQFGLQLVVFSSSLSSSLTQLPLEHTSVDEHVSKSLSAVELEQYELEVPGLLHLYVLYAL